MNGDGRAYPRRLIGILGIVGLVAWITVPLVVTGLLLTTGGQQRLVAVEQEVWLPVERAESSTTRNLSLEFLWESSGELKAPYWTGLVQRVIIQPGSEVASGQTIATIDGVDRRAMHTTAPFYRVLAVGDRGPDVAELKRLMAGYVHQSAGDKFDFATLSAVRLYAAEVGVNESRWLDSFDPAWVVHLPSSDPFTLATVELAVGMPAPTVGTTLGTGVVSLSAGRLSSDLRAGSGEEVQSVETRAEFVRRLDSTFALPGETEVVTYRNDPLNFDEMGWLSSSDVERFRETLQQTPRRLPVVGNVPAVPGDLVVPAAAVSAGEAAFICARSSSNALAIRVEVVSGMGGVAVVRSEELRENLEVRLPSTDVKPCQ